MFNEASRCVGWRVTVVQIDTRPSHRICINDPSYITYVTLKPVLRMTSVIILHLVNVFKIAASLKDNQTKKNELGGKCGA